MNRRATIALGVLFLLLVGFLIFFGVVLYDPAAHRTAAVLPQTPPGKMVAPQVSIIDPKRGAQKSRVQIVEFGDYQCEYCRQMEDTLNAALRTYPSLTLVWKDLPNVEAHPEAKNAALAARCAGKQGKFWEYHDALYANQTILNTELYPKLAQQLGLSTQNFQNCMDSQEMNPYLVRNVEEAQALGVDGTPYFFIGDVRISGQIAPGELAGILKNALAQ